LTAEREPRRLTPGSMNAAYPAWMPDSDEIIFSAKRHLWRLAVSGRASGETPAQLPFVGENGIMPVVSRSLPGRPTQLAYVHDSRDSNIWRVETSAPGAPATSPPVVSVSSTMADINPDLSPDARRVTFASNRSGAMEIWRADADGAHAVQLTSMSAQTTTPRWSPDGRLIAFQSNLGGQFDIYVVSPAGDRPRNLTSHPANDHVPSFSRDGRWVYFGSTRSGGFRLFKVPTEGGEAVPVTDDVGFRAVEGTDGKDLYYSDKPGEGVALWRKPKGGGPAAKVLDGVVSNSFAVVDQGIYFVDRHANETRLEFHDFATGRSATVARKLGDITPLLTASADGRTILFSRVDYATQDLMLVEHFR
jgi:Tol biopolymer transport system component